MRIIETKCLGTLLDERNAARLDLLKAENAILRNQKEYGELQVRAARARKKIETCDAAMASSARYEKSCRW